MWGLDINIFKGNIAGIRESGSIHYLSIDCTGTVIKVLTLELDERFSAGTSVNLLFKENCVIVLKSETSVSIVNCLPSRVVSIKTGKILSEMGLETPVGNITALMISEQVLKMGLEIGSDVFSLINASEIALSIGTVDV